MSTDRWFSLAKNQQCHDDVIKWKHFSRYWPFMREIHRWIPFAKASDAELWCFFFISVWSSGWGEHLRRYRANYDITAMAFPCHDVTISCTEPSASKQRSNELLLGNSILEIQSGCRDMSNPFKTGIEPNFHSPWLFSSMDFVNEYTSNGSWCIGIKGEMSGTVCVTFTWDIYIYMSCL